jgi:twitching motility protein PilT
MEPILFGQLLLNFHLINEQDLNRCLHLQSQFGRPKPLGQILIEEGLIDEKMLATILTVQNRELDEGMSQLGMTSHELEHRLQNTLAVDYLKLAQDLEASDLYLSSGKKPMVRLHGRLKDLPAPTLERDECEQLVFSLLSPEQGDAYESEKRLDFCTSIPEVGRFRINVFQHNGGLGAVIRLLVRDVRTLESIGLPSAVGDMINHRHGLVLITGSTGSGKTTTLGAMMNEINRLQHRHIITLEDPIEMVLESDQSLVTQREIGTHTASFADGLRSAMREDPDVIVVGEMRDPETFAVALTAAETGHLVFGTLHTRSAHGTIMRVIDQFPASQRDHIRTMLAGTLRGVVCQELVPTIDGRSRALAAEVMVANPAISNLIRENRTWQIPNVMQTNTARGMTTLDDSLDDLVRRDLIPAEEAVNRAHDQSRFLKPAPTA